MDRTIRSSMERMKMLKMVSKPAEQDEREPIDTRVPIHVRIINGALDSDPSSPAAIVLQGRIDPNTLRFLKVDNEYQRPLGDRSDIFDALREGKVVPNIEIGVRGQNFETEGNDVVITSPCYIIDGWQRVGNALRLLELIPDHPVRIFASVHFGTDQIWERHRFNALNKNVKKVSPNLHMRNMRDSNDAILTLFGLSNSDKSFPLFKKVGWSQNMQRGQLISALVLAKSAMFLHGHKGGIGSTNVESVSASLTRTIADISLPKFRSNVSSFFKLVDDCWPLNVIEYTRTASQIKSTFLYELGRVLSRHPVFWDEADRTLQISADDRRKLAKFPINDPQVAALAGTGGKARNILYQLIVDHMNSGRRENNRLVSRFEQIGKK